MQDWKNTGKYYMDFVNPPGAPFTNNGLTLIPAWLNNYTPRKVWDEITYPFLNFNGCTIEV